MSALAGGGWGGGVAADPQALDFCPWVHKFVLCAPTQSVSGRTSSARPASASSEPPGPGCHEAWVSCPRSPPPLFLSLPRAHDWGRPCSPGRGLRGGAVSLSSPLLCPFVPRLGEMGDGLRGCAGGLRSASTFPCSLLLRCLPPTAASPCCFCLPVQLCCCSRRWGPRGPRWSQCTRGTTPHQSRWPSTRLSSADTLTC